MIDKDKVLPLVHFGQCVDTVHRLRCHEEQRDADWERVKPLVEAVEMIQNESLMRLRGLSNPVDRLPWEKTKALANEALAQFEERRTVSQQDKDTILPLIDFLAVIAAWENTAALAMERNVYQAVAKAQQEADWKRIQCLIGAVL